MGTPKDPVSTIPVRRGSAYIAGLGCGLGKGLAFPRLIRSVQFLIECCIYYNSSVPNVMGREIVSISVPIGSQEWHMIQAWKQDSNTNVSVNICAALRENGETVAHLQALQRKLETLRTKLMVRKGSNDFNKDDWDEYFGEA